MEAQQQVRRAAISVVVTRANGDVEDYGVVSFGDLDADAQARFDEARARGERVDESDLFVPDETPSTIRFGGQAVKE